MNVWDFTDEISVIQLQCEVGGPPQAPSEEPGPVQSITTQRSCFFLGHCFQTLHFVSLVLCKSCMLNVTLQNVTKTMEVLKALFKITACFRPQRSNTKQALTKFDEPDSF